MSNEHITLLSAEDFAAFVETLDQPPEPTPGLVLLMNSNSPWDDEHE